MKRTTDRPQGVVRFSPSEEVYIVCSYRLRSRRYRRDMYYDDDEYRLIKEEARRAVRSVRRRGESAPSSAEEGDREDFTSMGIERLLMTRAEREEQKAGKKRTIRAVLEEQERQRVAAEQCGGIALFPDAADAIAEVCSRESLQAREAALASGRGLSDELVLEAEAAEQAAKKAAETTGDGSNRRRRRRRSLSDGAIFSTRATEYAWSPPRGNADAGNVSDAVRVRSFSNPKPRPSSSFVSLGKREATVPIFADDVEARFATISIDKQQFPGVKSIDARRQKHNEIDLYHDRRSQ